MQHFTSSYLNSYFNSSYHDSAVATAPDACEAAVSDSSMKQGIQRLLSLPTTSRVVMSVLSRRDFTMFSMGLPQCRPVHCSCPSHCPQVFFACTYPITYAETIEAKTPSHGKKPRRCQVRTTTPTNRGARIVPYYCTVTYMKTASGKPRGV